MENLSWVLSSVLIIIFASITMYYLADVHFCTFSFKKKIFSIVYFIAYLALNIIAQIIYGFELYGDLYIIFAQIPLYILLKLLTQYRGIKLVFLYLSITIFSSAAMFISSFIIFFTLHFAWINSGTVILFRIMFAKHTIFIHLTSRYIR